MDSPREASEHSYAKARGANGDSGARPVQGHRVAELGWETRLLVLGSSPLSGWTPLFLGNGSKMALMSKEVPPSFWNWL